MLVSYQVFARKYRPKTFNDVLGQDHVIQTLRNAIDQDRIAQAYLFVGPRGTGKTSTARILAKALNADGGPSIEFDADSDISQEIAEGRSLDVLEIDGASNNGVEQVRDLRDNVRFAPARCRYKIIYIDEVHMLTTAAFNALLKTLEEPPEHVKFIFATTEPNKILPTIISRCQRFDLRPIGTQTIADHLTYICEKEGVTISPAAAWAVAKGADGGMRDAQSMLDQLVAFCGNNVDEENVLDVFGFTSRETVAAFTLNILNKKTSEALNTLNEQSTSGKDLGQLLEDTIGCLRALLVAKVDPNAGSDGIPQNLWEQLTTSSVAVPVDRLLQLVDIFADTESRMKWASNKKLHLEIGVIKAIQSLNDVRISDVITALAGAGALPEGRVAAPTNAKIQTPQTAATPSAPTTEPAPQPQSNPQTSQVADPSTTTTLPETAAPAQQQAPAESINLQPEPQQAAAPAPQPAQEQTPAPTQPEPQPDPQTTPPPQAEPFTPPPLKRKTTVETISSLDALIDSAPEQSAAPPAPEPEAAPAVSNQQQAAPAEKKVEEPAADEDSNKPEFDEDAFYKDPLIQKALEIFEASLRPSS